MLGIGVIAGNGILGMGNGIIAGNGMLGNGVIVGNGMLGNGVIAGNGMLANGIIGGHGIAVRPMAIGLEKAIFENTKYLGVIFDHKLTWKLYIDDTQQKIERRMSLLKRLAGVRWGSATSTFLTTYRTFIKPVMTYCISTLISEPIKPAFNSEFEAIAVSLTHLNVCPSLSEQFAIFSDSQSEFLAVANDGQVPSSLSVMECRSLLRELHEKHK
ncbi:hypothetical protein CEXT_621381 [Caerostris extrusa]|uniref:Uncharacterized protein n=1 Tax=Caerostris extrusa TaxID=172846 RepID=A0AAV4V154_CAEEX|nr:hypothetical protein CEXT_621381 [Caerostris extrusa]